jgi:uncharacterized protein (TIGR00730 family)
MTQKRHRSPEINLRRILGSPTYLRAYEDIALLHRVDLRAVRLQLEAMKAEIVQDEEDVRSTLVFFGGARIRTPEDATEQLKSAQLKAAKDPGNTKLAEDVKIAENLLAMSPFYDEARKLARIVSLHGQAADVLDLVICTGGGPGIMEAGNRGAFEAGKKSIGLNITLPHEQVPNAYITPELCFQFHYFAIRKMHFLMRAKAAVFFPGGFGTMDELFETLTLIQTGKMDRVPLILVGKDFWNRLIDWEFFRLAGTISPEDVELFSFCDTAEEAWDVIHCAYPSLE